MEKIPNAYSYYTSTDLKVVCTLLGQKSSNLDLILRCDIHVSEYYEICIAA